MTTPTVATLIALLTISLTPGFSADQAPLIAGQSPSEAALEQAVNNAVTVALQRQVRFSFAGLDLASCVDMLAVVTGLRIDIDPSVPDQSQSRQISVASPDKPMPAAGVLKTIVDSADCRYEVRKGRIIILPAAAAKPMQPEAHG